MRVLETNINFGIKIDPTANDCRKRPNNEGVKGNCLSFLENNLVYYIIYNIAESYIPMAQTSSRFEFQTVCTSKFV